MFTKPQVEYTTGILVYLSVCVSLAKIPQQVRSDWGEVCRQDISFSIPVYRSVHSSLQSNNQYYSITS